MNAKRFVRLAPRIIAAGVGMAAAAYAAYVANAWRTYGEPPSPRADERDELLDQFMPAYDVVERHRIRVSAPAAAVFDAACEQDLQQSGLVRAIFRTRELVLGASGDDRPQPRGLLDEMKSLGWGVLAEVPGREIVVGAVTRPWEADVTFRALPQDQFARYWQPGLVKIVWTLRAEPLGDHESMFITETRAVATDSVARARFRRYWAFVSPGVSTIRWLSLRPLKRAAERRALTQQAG
jgi:hypothetical protein